MAFNYSTEFPGQIDTTTNPTGFPFGQAQNVTVFGDGTGTPLDQKIYNDLFGFQATILSEVGIVPNGIVEQVGASQYFNAVRKIHGVTVNDYVALRALDSSELITGTPITITNAITAGVFIVTDATVTDDNVTLIVFTDDSTRHAARIYDNIVNPDWDGGGPTSVELPHLEINSSTIQARFFSASNGLLRLNTVGGGDVQILDQAVAGALTVHNETNFTNSDGNVVLQVIGGTPGGVNVAQATGQGGVAPAATIDDLHSRIGASDGTTARDILPGDFHFETKLTATGNVVLNLNAASFVGIGDGAEATFYYPSLTGTGTLTFTAAGVTLLDARIVTPGFKAVIKYEGGTTFNYTGP